VTGWTPLPLISHFHYHFSPPISHADSPKSHVDACVAPTRAQTHSLKTRQAGQQVLHLPAVSKVYGGAAAPYQQVFKHLQEQRGGGVTCGVYEALNICWDNKGDGGRGEGEGRMSLLCPRFTAVPRPLISRYNRTLDCRPLLTLDSKPLRLPPNLNPGLTSRALYTLRHFSGPLVRRYSSTAWQHSTAQHSTSQHITSHHSNFSTIQPVTCPCEVGVR
jgi:hypothetical protein